MWGINSETHLVPASKGMVMKFKTISYEKEGPLAWITLNRPERLNAFHFGLGAELERAYARDELQGKMMQVGMVENAEY